MIARMASERAEEWRKERETLSSQAPAPPEPPAPNNSLYLPRHGVLRVNGCRRTLNTYVMAMQLAKQYEGRWPNHG